MKDRGLAYLLLLGAVGWVALAMSDPLTRAWEGTREGHTAFALRLAMSLLALGFAMAALVLAERLGPGAHRALNGATLVLLGASVVDVAMRGGVDPDEMIHLHQAWLFGTPLVPYRDFMQVHQVTWPLLTSPLLHAMQDNLHVFFVMRGLMIGMFVAVAVVTALLARRLGASALTTVLLMTCLGTFLTGSLQSRPDPAVNLMNLLALLAVIDRRWLVGGLLSGAAVLLGQKGAFAAVVLLVGMWCVRDGHRAWLTYVAGMAITASLGFVWALSRGLLSDYWTFTYLYCLPFGSWLTGTHAASTHQSYATLALKLEMANHPVLGALTLCGAWLACRKLGREGILVVVSLAGTAAIALALNFGYPHYVLFPTALTCVLAAAALKRIAPEGPTRDLTTAAPQVAVLCMAFLALLRYAGYPPVGVDLTRPQLALSHVRPGGIYYGTNMMSHPIFRQDAGYFYWYAELQAEIIQRLGLPPRPVVPDLVAHPPDVVVTENEALLKPLRQAGFEYESLAPFMWARALPPKG